ncbi:BRCT domain-containing protein [Candidatus Thioglobus sp. NP1]|uniref:BRCT domain-containing protein n=1 Tax=Candidatus Thioglobus sp. NP1 TaxID=2508687 RepID=UPI000DED48B3|nr:BRCT domain-containing protein [Candidatus Thioglobus sp. NP1]AXE62584.1 DNA ligase [Candidatus Thioglobus sp. NP1]
MLTNIQIQDITNQRILISDLTDEDLLEFCKFANQRYRDGSPIISDEDYDFIYALELSKRLPDHPFLQKVEDENVGFSEEKIKLPEKMLSTDKAYSWEEVNKWLERIRKFSEEINFSLDNIQIKGTAKLDGFAGFDDGNKLYTRGDGNKGSDITRVFDRGLGTFNNSHRGQGPGEIVVKRSYFEKHLSGHFEYPRNFQASLIKEKELDQFAKDAIANEAALFVPFSQLPFWAGSISEFTNNFNSIVSDLESGVDFDIDGVVFEIVNSELKSHMGSNRKFHRWQIAFKENKEKAQVKVLSVTAQVGRTGKITPVAELEPTQLSGATIYRASGHHYGLVKEQGLGSGSIIELTRSGLVIPKINKVIRSVKAEIPSKCPSCDENLTWESDFLMCLNHETCKDQIIGKIIYFYKVLANNDGFGEATIQKLYDEGIRNVGDIYKLTEFNLVSMGFGEKTSQNLINQLIRSRQESIEDWRFLAAFGVLRLGMGNCENLLKNYPLDKVFDLSVDDISNIDGFAELTAELIFNGLLNIKPQYENLIKDGFELEKTLILGETYTSDNLYHNKKIVFTGSMSSSRAELQKQAKAFGAIVGSSVSSKTDLLIIGENVGQSKIKAAEKYGVEILSEAEYLQKLVKL